MEQEDTTAVLQEGLSDRKLSRSTLETEFGGLNYAVEHYAENPTPNLIIIEADEAQPDDTLLGQIDELAEVCDEGTNLLVIGHSNDISLYRELTNRGVGEYLLKPVPPRQIFEAVTGIFVDPDAPPQGRLLSFIGSRGGCGSSTIAHNVGWLLGNEYNEEVSIIDLDITFGTVGLAFNVEAPSGIQSIMGDPDRLDEQLLERFLVEYDENTRLLVSPSTLDADEKAYMESLDKLLELVRRRSSFVILDVPHRWAPWTQQVLLDADDTVVTGVMDLASLRDTKNLIDRLKAQRGENAPVHLVLNHVGAFRKTELSAKDFESALDLAPNVVLPHDPAIFGSASNNGQMLGELNGKHRAVDSLRGFALGLSGRQPTVPRRKPGLLAKLGLGGRGKARPATA